MLCSKLGTALSQFPHHHALTLLSSHLWSPLLPTGEFNLTKVMDSTYFFS